MTTHAFRLTRVVRIALVAFAAVWCLSAQALVPDKINYQGRLTDAGGNPVTASVPMVFKLYTVVSGGSALYSETQTVTVTSGIFNVAIGSVTPISLPFDVPYYLGVTVGADAEMTPRQAVQSSPYALSSASAEALAASATVGGAQITGSISAATVPASQISGTVGTAQIANNAVTQAKLSPSGGAAGQVLGTDGTNLQWQTAGGGGGITGSGTLNFLPKWTPNSTSLGNSAVFENSGLVGIGHTPSYTLDILGFPNAQINLFNGSNSTTALVSKYTNRFEINPSDAFQVSVGGIAAPHFWVGAGGSVGIGTTTPVNHVQIGSAPSFVGNDLAIGNGNKGMSFMQSDQASTWYSSASFALMPNGGTGAVGIGTQSPVNNLQIGSVGTTGYSGNDIAFGNGLAASGIAQTSGVAQWYSTTNMALMPQGNGHGRVGINTTAPGYPLEVDDYVSIPPIFGYYTATANGDVYSGKCQISCTGAVSIYTPHDVLAAEFDVISDARIKVVHGTSSSARDLEILNALQVTDYTLRDTAAYGNRPFKKVIAQQVETVYPQVVSRHVEFIPNVYQMASTATKTSRGILLHFETGHHLSAQAKRIKLLTSGDQTMQRVAISSIPSDSDVLIDATQLNGDKVFVYGEEVDDFRTIDYDGLTTLNISATQELSKRLTRQQSKIADLVTEKGVQLADLHAQLAAQARRIDDLETQTAEITVLKQERQMQMVQINALERQAAEIATLKQQVAQLVQIEEAARRPVPDSRLAGK